MENKEFNQQLAEIQKDYLDFLDDEEDQGVYHKRVKQMIGSQGRRIIVDISDLRKKKPVRAHNLITSSGEELIAFHNALKDFVSTVDPGYEYDEFFIGFEGSFGNRHLTPRNVSARYLNSLICVEGIVTQCSLVRPKLVRSVHYCPVTEKMSERRYTDLTSLSAILSVAVYPTKDADGNFLETEYGLSTYKDHQTLSLQEMPEKAPVGQLPRVVSVICDYDLADKCQPGDRVQIVGLYRCLPSKQGGITNGVFRTVLLANNITLLSKDTKLIMSRADITNCRKLAKKVNIFELLSRSIAPTIHGHEYVKKAVLCMLLGGVEKKLKNGTRLRGDINILLIGDPSVAKSQILRYILSSAPRAIATTGRGSSGVGLTAAVTTDHETGEKRLEAGAMVLADRGIVCIDEFDKMTDIDRTAIHEVMEQGRVTIAKAGIHAQLNARCSVLAAANPVYGKYDQYKPPMENIGLQDSLLSRFDLLFVMLDVIDNEADSKIADHVVRIHRYRNPDEHDGEVLPMGSSVDMLITKPGDVNDTEEAFASMYEKYNPLLHGASRSKSDRIFSVKFMRMYIHIAKTLKPVLTDIASEVIAEEYSRLRSQDFVETGAARTQPVTVRTLETLIRLATAHAKARLSCNIDLEDAQAAISLVQYAYFKKVLEKDKKRRRSSESGNAYFDFDSEAETISVQRKKRVIIEEETSLTVSDNTETGESECSKSDSRSESQSTSQTRVITEEETSFTVSDNTETGESEGSKSDSRSESQGTSQTQDSVQSAEISNERLKVFKKATSRVFQSQNTQSLKLDNLIKLVNSSESQQFTEIEVEAALEHMTDENQVMVSDNIVFLI